MLHQVNYLHLSRYGSYLNWASIEGRPWDMWVYFALQSCLYVSAICFSPSVTLLLPMDVPAAPNWSVSEMVARQNSAIIASRYGTQIKLATWLASKGHRLCGYGQSTPQASAMARNLGQVCNNKLFASYCCSCVCKSCRRDQSVGSAFLGIKVWVLTFGIEPVALAQSSVSSNCSTF